MLSTEAQKGGGGDDFFLYLFLYLFLGSSFSEKNDDYCLPINSSFPWKKKNEKLEIQVAIWFVVVILTFSCFAFTVHYEAVCLIFIIKLISHNTELFLAQ